MIQKQIKIKLKKILYPLLNILSKKYIVKRINQSPNKSILVTEASLVLEENIEYLKYQKLIPYNGVSQKFEKDINVHFYSNVFIDLNTGVLINSDKDIIRESLKNEYRTDTDLSKLTTYFDIDQGLVSVINPHLNVGYFHIWFDGLIKLYYLSLLKDKVTIVISKNAPAIYHQVLREYKDIFSILTVENHRYVKVKEACFVRHIYWAKHAPYFSDKISDFFKSRIIGLSTNSTLEAHDRIFVKRKNSIRNIINDNEVEQLFLSFGFKVISFEDYNVFDQAYIVNKAKVIAGIHGAAFTNLIFANPDLTIIELQNHAIVTSFYFMSYQTNLKYHPIFSLTTNIDEIKDPYKEREEFYSQKLEPVMYDTKEIKSVLEKI